MRWIRLTRETTTTSPPSRHCRSSLRHHQQGQAVELHSRRSHPILVGAMHIAVNRNSVSLTRTATAAIVERHQVLPLLATVETSNTVAVSASIATINTTTGLFRRCTRRTPVHRMTLQAVTMLVEVNNMVNHHMVSTLHHTASHRRRMEEATLRGDL